MTNEKHDAPAYPDAETFRFQFPEPHWCEIEDGKGYPSELRKVLLNDVEAFGDQMKGLYHANCSNVFDYIKCAFTLYRHLDAYLRGFICGAEDGEETLADIIEYLRKVDDDSEVRRQYVDFDGRPVGPEDESPFGDVGKMLAAMLGEN